MRLSAFCALFVLAGSAGALGLALAADFEDPPSELATVLVRKAKNAERAGDMADAYVYYSQASALQPRNKGYRAAAAALQSRASRSQAAAQMKAAAPALEAEAWRDTEEYHPALSGGGSPGLSFDSLTARELAREPQLASPPRLQATAGRYDFDLNDPPRGLFDKVAAKFNLQIVYDSDYPPGGEPMRFRITQVDYRDALGALQAATGSFVIPLAPRVIMVARDTAAKRNDLEQFVTLTVPVPQVITTQELTEIMQLVREVSSVEKIGWDTNDDQIVMRDRVSRVALAQSLVEQLFTYHPEVMIDLELLQVSNTDTINYGFNVTDSFPLVYLGSIQNSMASIPSGIANLLTFGAGRTLIGVAAAEVQAMFNETFSNSKSLYSARLRSASGQAGVFHVGEKYPIITSGFVAASTTNTTGSTVPRYAAPPAVSFENLGLEVKATPRVHGADAVSMSIEATYEVLNGQSADGIPVILTNKITTDIRLRNEEWAVVGGLISDSSTKTKSGFWALAGIPVIGNLFRQTSIDKQSGAFLIGIRPHILYIGPDENVTQSLRAGTDARPYTPL
jgi:general secretion pathway protein D